MSTSGAADKAATVAGSIPTRGRNFELFFVFSFVETDEPKFPITNYHSYIERVSIVKYGHTAFMLRLTTAGTVPIIAPIVNA